MLISRLIPLIISGGTEFTHTYVQTQKNKQKNRWNWFIKYIFNRRFSLLVSNKKMDIFQRIFKSRASNVYSSSLCPISGFTKCFGDIINFLKIMKSVLHLNAWELDQSREARSHSQMCSSHYRLFTVYNITTFISYAIETYNWGVQTIWIMTHLRKFMQEKRHIYIIDNIVIDILKSILLR